MKSCMISFFRSSKTRIISLQGSYPFTSSTSSHTTRIDTNGGWHDAKNLRLHSHSPATFACDFMRSIVFICCTTLRLKRALLKMLLSDTCHAFQISASCSASVMSFNSMPLTYCVIASAVCETWKRYKIGAGLKSATGNHWLGLAHHYLHIDMFVVRSANGSDVRAVNLAHFDNMSTT
jgi:hypothetical protein